MGYGVGQNKTAICLILNDCTNHPNFLGESHIIDQQLEPNFEQYDIVRVLNNVEFEDLDSNEDTDEELDPPIRLREAEKSLETLRLFYLQQENEGSPISVLDACSDYIRQ
ncbi:Hypothetical protein CINCED_3A015490 [Cinara cedri]|uniref:Uncharacterized protein n=1 Tax=Cinara cedri TaxID=506608 RepID=A0A5E4MZ06_9HEMI|nr:Hypothetical protein CINCED_3A015490 [Cinara cedri]